MTQKQIIASAVFLGVVCITAFVLFQSPVAEGLFREGNDTADDIFGLALAVLMLAGIVGLSIAIIIACCYLGKRLGYDMYAGLLLLVPVVNVVVLFAWAFRCRRMKRHSYDCGVSSAPQSNNRHHL